MVVGNAAGPKIDVQAIVKIASLFGGSVFRGFLSDDATAPGSEVPAAGSRLRLKHVAFEPGLRELVSCGQAGNAGAQDEHGFIPA
jgi:hypothetical protein